jgi:hypothetical protein
MSEGEPILSRLRGLVSCINACAKRLLEIVEHAEDMPWSTWPPQYAEFDRALKTLREAVEEVCEIVPRHGAFVEMGPTAQRLWDSLPHDAKQWMLAHCVRPKYSSIRKCYEMWLAEKKP